LAVIKGGVYQIDLGKARGHEQRGHRFGVVVSPAKSWLSVATVVPTSTSARQLSMRPRVEVAGAPTVLLVDQIRSIDTDYIHELVGMLSRDEMAELEDAISRYLGLVADETGARE
jgi:mRNA interferase MazF